jgi:hypothetical protein
MWTHDFKIWSITEKMIAAYLLPEKGSLQTRRRDRPPAHRGIGERPRSSTGAPTPLHFTARLRPTAIKTTRIPSCRHDKLGRVTSPIRRHATHRLVATALHLPHPTNLPTAAYGADGNGRFLRRARRQTRGSGAAPEPRRIPRPFLACLHLSTTAGNGSGIHVPPAIAPLGLPKMAGSRGTQKNILLFYCEEMRELAEQVVACNDDIELRSIFWRSPTHRPSRFTLSFPMFNA